MIATPNIYTFIISLCTKIEAFEDEHSNELNKRRIKKTHLVSIGPRTKGITKYVGPTSDPYRDALTFSIVLRSIEIRN